MTGRREKLLLFALTVAIFLLFPGRREFAASHEARVADVAREMAASGPPWRATPIQVPGVRLIDRLGVQRLQADPDLPPITVNPWVVPVLNGDIRLQKPPLPYWCAAMMFRWFGVSEATARIVPAILGALAILLLFDLTRLLFGARIALAAAFIQATTVLVSEEYRLAMADPYLAFFTIAAVLAWVRASRGGRATTLALCYVVAAAGALSKGPLIFLHVAIPIALYHLCFRARLPRSWRGHLLGGILFLLLVAPWPLAVMRQVPHATQLWQYESVGEISGENQENVRAWWYYLLNLPLLSLPWTALWLVSLILPFARNRSRRFFPILWYAAVVLIFTFVGQKKFPYLLPMMPAQSMMIAIAAVHVARIARRNRMRGWAAAVIVVQLAIGTVWAAGIPFLVRGDSTGRLPADALALAALLCTPAVILAMRRMRVIPWIAAQSLAYALIVLAFCDFYLTPINNERSPRQLCRELQSLADGRHRAILESKLPEEAAFYLPLHPPAGPAPTEYLVVVDDHPGAEHRARTGRPEPPVDPHQFDDWVPGAKVIGIRRVQLDGARGDSRWKVYELSVRRTGFANRGGKLDQAAPVRTAGESVPSADRSSSAAIW